MGRFIYNILNYLKKKQLFRFLLRRFGSKKIMHFIQSYFILFY